MVPDRALSQAVKHMVVGKCENKYLTMGSLLLVAGGWLLPGALMHHASVNFSYSGWDPAEQADTSLSCCRWASRAHLERVNHGLAGLHVLAIVVVDDVKVLRRQAAGVGGAAPNHARAAFGQGPILAEGSLGAELALQAYISVSDLEPLSEQPS